MNLYNEILLQYWGYSQFRPMQEDIIMSVANGNDTLGLLPTGGGKSITFQVPALAKKGLCLVITPLIALMKDQVENLKEKGIKATAIYSGLSKHEIDYTLENCIYGDVKFLYISPERLSTELFRERLKKMNINLITVDESHCISQWGYDFRPAYLKIAEIREIFPSVPVLALTATATPKVVLDIQEKLNFRKNNVLRNSFNRKNLAYVVRYTEDKLKNLVNIITKIRGSGVVYARSRKKTKEIALFLRDNNITADYYHAGLSYEARNLKQDYWKNNRIQVIVATNAFGMGIDKPDVRFVVHLDLPDSLEAYFQEAGRGGRDGRKSYAIILLHEEDKIKLKKRISVSFPELDYIKKVYYALGNYFQIPVGGGKHLEIEFKISNFVKEFNLELLRTFSSLKILQKEGYIEITDEMNNPSRIIFLMSREDLYKFQVSHANIDAFIKLLLRSYTGIFNDYAIIDENDLATKSKTTRDNIYKYLLFLSNNKVINYIPQKNNPVIIFTEERLDEKALYISPENYKLRKEIYENQISTVLDYAFQDAKCRNIYLLEYFGEKDAKPCGICDVCLQKNHLDLTNFEFDSILGEIKSILQKKSYVLDELVDKVSFESEKSLKVIRWMLDEQKIQYTKDNKLTMMQ